MSFTFLFELREKEIKIIEGHSSPNPQSIWVSGILGGDKISLLGLLKGIG